MYLHLCERVTLLLVLVVVLLVDRVRTLAAHAVVSLLTLHDLRRTARLRSCYGLLGYLLNHLVRGHRRCLSNCCWYFTHLWYMEGLFGGIWGVFILGTEEDISRAKAIVDKFLVSFTKHLLRRERCFVKDILKKVLRPNQKWLTLD